MKDCQDIFEFCFSLYFTRVRKIETALCLEKVQLNQCLSVLLGKVSHSLYGVWTLFQSGPKVL